MTVLSILMNKGGVSKTITLSNLAAALSLKFPQKKILVIDMDAQGSSSIALGVNPNRIQYTTYQVLMKICAPEEAIQEVSKNLCVLPSNRYMNFFTTDLMDNRKAFPKPFNLLKNVVDQLRRQFDYILIDPPPSMELIAGNVIVASDQIIIPFQCETLGVQGLIQVVDVIKDFQKTRKAKAQITGVFGVLIDNRTKLHQELWQQAQIYCAKKGLPLLQTKIPRSIKFPNAIEYSKKPLVFVEPNSHLSQLFFQLIEEVFIDE